MKIILASLVCFILTGCPSIGVQSMTADQIKATAGMATCSSISSMYGKGASVTVNLDDVRKGATSVGKTAITCGDTSMVIDTNVGVATPASAPRAQP